MKLLLKIIIVLLILAVAGYLGGSYFVNKQTRIAVETRTGDALGVPAILQRANVGILTGNFALTDLDVANVTNFQSPHLLRMGSCKGSVRLGTLLGEVAEIPNITLNNIELHLERLETAGNYDHVVSSMRQGEQQPDEDGRRYIIHELIMRDVVIHVTLVPGVEDPLRLRIPIDEMRLTNVGTEGDRGVLLQEVAGQVFKALLAAALEVAGDELPSRIANEIAGRLGELEGLDSILDVAGERIRDLEEILPDSPLRDLIPGRGN